MAGMRNDPCDRSRYSGPRKPPTGDSQPAADGAELVNFYALQPVPRDEIKAPVVLYGTPGYKKVLLTNIPEASTAQSVGVLGFARIRYVDHHEYFLTAILEDFPNLPGPPVVQLPQQLTIFAHFDPTQDPNFPPNNSAAGVETSLVARTTLSAVGEKPPLNSGNQARLVSHDNVTFLLDVHRNLYACTLTRASTGHPSLSIATMTLPTDAMKRRNERTPEVVDIAMVEGYLVAGLSNGNMIHTKRGSSTFETRTIDYAGMRTSSDTIVGLASHREVLYVFGEETTEIWSPTKTSGFAFRKGTNVFEVGCLARPTIQSYDDGVCFVASNAMVYRLSGGGPSRLSNEVVEYDIQRCNHASLRAFTYVEEGHYFYSLSMDISLVGQKNWTCDLDTGFWHNRSATGITSAMRFNGYNYVGLHDMREPCFYGLDIGTEAKRVPDPNNVGKLIYGDVPVDRTAVGPILHANQAAMRVHSFHMDLDYERPTNYQKPETPANLETIKLTWSDDGKERWRGESLAAKPLDASGRIKWTRMGQFRAGRNFRIQVLSENRVKLLGAYIRATTGLT